MVGNESIYSVTDNQTTTDSPSRAEPLTLTVVVAAVCDGTGQL